MPKIFISYSHDDPRHEQRVLELANRLREDGIDAEIDQYEPAPPEGWPMWCERQIKKADYVLLMCTETYMRRVDGEEEPGRGHGVLWEARIIRQLRYDEGSVGTKFIPIRFFDGSDDHIPTPMRGGTRYVVDTVSGYEGLYRQVTNQPGVVRPLLGKLKALPPKQFGTVTKAPIGFTDFAVFRDIDAPWCPEMVALQAGDFLMGSPESEEGRRDNEGPQHKVTIGYRFAMGRSPVTVGEYRRFVEATDRRHEGGLVGYTGLEWKLDEAKSWHNPGFAQTDRHPVVGVNWQDASVYCDWLANETGKPYRLPSEAEWEYACRAGTKTPFSFGKTMTKKNANFPGVTVGKTTEVGSFPPNLWGLYDMHGNVWEWVEDVWHDDYEGAPADGSAWTDAEGKNSWNNRSMRGGSWGTVPGQSRSASRLVSPPGVRGFSLGFRVARTLD